MKTQSEPILYGLAAAIALGLSGLAAPVANANTFAEAIASGKTKLSFRARHEAVDQDSFDEDAAATTLRARLSYSSGSWKGLGLTAEVDVVEGLFDEEFNSGAGTSGPERAMFPVVADPDGHDINQAYLSYKTANDTQLKLGRQRILVDNQRFVGGVGWRQNEQTYDALSVASNVAGNQVFYAYVDNVNRIFGNDVTAGDHESDTHLLNISRKFAPGKLTLYYYGIDNDDAATFSSDTIGLRWGGKAELGGRQLSYGLEYASQDDAANNPVSYSADYWRLDGALSLEPVKLLAGVELLGGDSDQAGQAFRTPLATLHAFNGWTDQFLATPGAGLQDVFVGASGKWSSWSWLLKFHDFETEDGGAALGSEWNGSLTTKFAKHYSVLAKVGHFNSDTPAKADTTKFWLQFVAAF